MKLKQIEIDMNNPIFQKNLFALEKNELTVLVKILYKISQMTWPMLYADKGLKWESISSKKTNNNDRIYSFRFSQKYRATALRDENFLRLLTLHTDHDSAYKN
jgi:hypothetical protein